MYIYENIIFLILIGTGTETELTRKVAHDHSEDVVHINDVM